MQARIGNYTKCCCACGAKIERCEEDDGYDSDAIALMCRQCANIIPNRNSDLCITSMQRFLKGNVV